MNSSAEVQLHQRKTGLKVPFTGKSVQSRAEGNTSAVSEFILVGLTDDPDLQVILFAVFLVIYLVSVFGNLGLIALIQVSPQLHTPMYFFLSHLAFVDFCYTSSVTPNTFVNFLREVRSITFYACATQVCCFITFVVCEMYLLSIMAYDRYVAIWNPLLYAVFMARKLCLQMITSIYTVIMSQRLCWVLVAVPYLYFSFVSLLVTIKIFTLSFCGSNVISHFYCDSLPFLPLLCSDTHEVELIILILAAFDLISSLLVVLVSYLLILITILRMNFAEGRQKAFSTCGSHLTVVIVFYGTLIFMYVQPNSSHSFDTDKVASIFYTMVIPILNPLIYSLRNKDVKYALQRSLNNLCKLFSFGFHKI
ncbi:olfactory receptor 8K3-like [Chionomys nivalis]|uniref:olfactory receptor 8K3-like n=1 Tax=Chionomys nivalis TaxID=269649 RepID=UPI0025922525|nr:olfactory receptor 8K3-like [Chionomys nivalis]